MADGNFDKQAADRAAALSTPLAELNPGLPDRFEDNSFWPVFERLRREDPVHYTAESEWGPYWSVTRFEDIVAVDTNHQAFSSDAHLGGITLADFNPDFMLPMFIAMDQPKHDVQRKTVSPSVSPQRLMELEPVIRQRAAALLDELPIGEEFDWVDRISIELTTQMLATLFDFPWEDRRKLTRWSDVATAIPGKGVVETEEEGQMELLGCLEYFTRLWNERINAPPQPDLISMLCHGESTRNMEPMEYLGNIILLIVGGNDTTRNSITGGLLALNQNPAEYDKLRADPSLIPSMVSEIIRWQTPLAHMRRTCVADTEVGGKLIKAGEKVVMWYVSGNRDESVIDNADAFIIDRERPRHHLSFGFGIHRCVGNRLAELQLRIVWEEVLKRFPRIDVVGEPRRVHSSFVKGYETLPVIIPARA
ncbi:MAG: cytochrome P450 [Caulobacter sp.]|nr:cytochrome P450 [Caulobacter sp.]